MDKDIKDAIFGLLKNRNHYPKNELYKKLSSDLKCEASNVDRVFNLMKDSGEVDFAENNPMFVRLTNKGLQATSSWCTKTIKYLGDNWIAIIALMMSLVTWIWK